MALFVSLFLGLFGPPSDTPGGVIVQVVPVVHIAAAVVPAEPALG